jgi:glycosyltransferase involved in cell wall biosynthesis
VSHSLQELALRKGIAANKIRVIHNAIDTSIFSFGERPEGRAGLGLEPDAKLVVAVGHLVQRKRHHVLIEAFARVRERWPEGQLVIIGARAGGDRYASELQALVDRLGLRNNVRFAGNLAPAEVATWLRAADVFALATAREGCCNAVLEALAVGTPVVTTDVGDNARFVTNEVNGRLVAVDDPAALAVALEASLDRRDWRREAIARRLHDQVGNWSDVAKRVLDFFRSSLEG